MSDTLPIGLTSPIQNINSTYSYLNSTSFYAGANHNYYDFYNRSVRVWGYWYDGWVPNFHNGYQGIFSTRIASTVVDAVTSLISGTRMLFSKKGVHSDDSTLDFISKWSERSGLQWDYKKANKFAGALTTSLIKLNKSGDDLWTEALRFDEFYFEVSAKKELEKVTMLVKCYTNTSNDGDSTNYYLVEKRYYDRQIKPELVNINDQKVWVKKEVKIPMVIYQVHRYASNSTNKMYPFTNQTISEKNLPYNIAKSIKNDFAIVELGKPQRLPFINLGCELIKLKDDPHRPNTPFGYSLIEENLAYFMIYDRAWSWFYRDMYLGKGTLLLPKAMSNPMDKMGVMGTGESNYELVESIDPEKQKPVNVQFDIRSESWERVQDNCIKRISSNLRFNTKTLAPYIAGDNSAQKTATEIDAEVDLTLSTIEEYRSNLVQAYNRLIETVLNFYGKESNIGVRFSTPALVNKDKIIDRAMAMYDKGFIDLEGALREIYPDMDDAQIKERVMKAEEQHKKNLEEQSFNIMGNEMGGL